MHHKQSNIAYNAASGSYPGFAHAAVDEMLNRYLIPQMFARVSQGSMSAADSVHATAGEMKRIWARWKAAGKV